MNVRSREWWFIAQVLVNFIALGILIAFIILAFTSSSERDTQQRQQALSVTCANARTQRSVLVALDDIARELGIPTHFTITEVPAGCDGT